MTMKYGDQCGILADQKLPQKGMYGKVDGESLGIKFRILSNQMYLH